MPALINWTGQLEPGVIDFSIHVSDWLPAICYLTGVEQELRPDLDGRNIWPLITGEHHQAGSRQMYWKTRVGCNYAFHHGADFTCVEIFEF